MKNLDTLVADIKYLRESHDEFRDEAKTELKEIRIQTQKTNGRLMKAESDISDLKELNQRQDTRIARFVAPVVTGLTVAGSLAIARYVFGM